jgi:hypothetical protein
VSILIDNFDDLFIFDFFKIVYGCFEVFFVDMMQNNHFKVIFLFCKLHNVVNSTM